MKKRLLMLLFPLIALGSCDLLGGDPSDEGQGTPILFTSNIKDRLDDENKYTIDILAYRPDDEILWNMYPLPYGYNNSEEPDIMTMDQAEFDKGTWSIFYPEKYPQLYFNAYYPQCIMAENPSDVFYAVGENQIEYQKYSDLLFAKTALTSDSIVHLEFNHMLSKIRFTFEDMIVPEGMVLTNTLMAYQLDTKNAVVTTCPDGKASIYMPKAVTDDGSYCYEAILPPQTLSNSDVDHSYGFCIVGTTVGDYFISLDSPLVVEQGYVYDILLGYGDETNPSILNISSTKWEM